jgi:molecular chaperone GrpE
MTRSNKDREKTVDENVDIVEETGTESEAGEAPAEDNVDDANLPEIEVEDAPEEPVDPVAAELEALRAERDDLKDQTLRARAEFENYRKRMAREGERVRKTAAEGLVRDLLPIVDNLERALSHVEDKSDGLAQGVEMIVKQFADILSNNGLDPIPALGEPFDPNIHEALTHQPSNEYPADSVMEEFQRGYRMGDFVLRPAQVVVSSGPVQSGENEVDETSNTEAAASETAE